MFEVPGPGALGPRSEAMAVVDMKGSKIAEVLFFFWWDKIMVFFFLCLYYICYIECYYVQTCVILCYNML